MLYKITWITRRFGTSQVEAGSIEEARKFAEGGKDQDFEEDDWLGDYEIMGIELVPAELLEDGDTEKDKMQQDKEAGLTLL